MKTKTIDVCVNCICLPICKNKPRLDAVMDCEIVMNELVDIASDNQPDSIEVMLSITDKPYTIGVGFGKAILKVRGEHETFFLHNMVNIRKEIRL